MHRRRAVIALPLAVCALAAAAPGAGAATVQMTPAAAPAGTAVLLRATGFPARRALVLRVRGRIAARGLTESSGGFVAATTVPTGAGRATPVAASAGGVTVVNRLVVSRLAGPRSTEVATSSGARARLSPSSAVPGASLRVTGAGLGGGQFARVVLGAATLAAGRTSPAGFFARTFRLPFAAPARRAVVVRAGRLSLPLALDVQPAVTAPAPARPAYTLVAAGDIACRPTQRRTAVECHQGDTARLVAGLRPDVVAPLGDLQYERGELVNFASAFDPTWGRFKERLRPVPGNHEYFTPGASAYFAYFGSAAGPRGRGYYSYDVGTWHVVALNSNCNRLDCAPGSAQLRWLRADLAAHPRQCTLAYWHHPLFSSGFHGDYPNVGALWSTLQDAGADVVLAGHDHSYERFAPQDAAGNADPERGLAQFVVGSGGREHRPFQGVGRNSVVRDASTFGVLALTLRPGAFDWRFAAEPGATFEDAGSASCH